MQYTYELYIHTVHGSSSLLVSIWSFYLISKHNCLLGQCTLLVEQRYSDLYLSSRQSNIDCHTNFIYTYYNLFTHCAVDVLKMKIIEKLTACKAVEQRYSDLYLSSRQSNIDRLMAWIWEPPLSCTIFPKGCLSVICFKLPPFNNYFKIWIPKENFFLLQMLQLPESNFCRNKKFLYKNTFNF